MSTSNATPFMNRMQLVAEQISTHYHATDDNHLGTILTTAGIDKLTFLALCYQESTFDWTEARLEQNFYRRYCRNRVPAVGIVDEVLMATSWGVTQMMGLSLMDVGFFRDTQHLAMIDPILDTSIPAALFMYLNDIGLQIGWSMRFMKKKIGVLERKSLPVDRVNLLRAWNGDWSGERGYAYHVESRKASIPSTIFHGL